MNPRGSSVDDNLVNLGLILIASVGVLAGVLWAAGAVAGWLSGAGLPASGLEGGFGVLTDPSNPAHALDAPGLSAILYWLVLAALAGLLAVAVWIGCRLVASTRHKTSRDPRRLAGVATGRDVATSASERALLARGRTLRPSLDD